MVLGVVDSCGVKVAFHGGVMFLAIVAQVVGDLGSRIHDVLAALFLAVEGAQRVDVGALLAGFAHLGFVLRHVLANGLAVLGAAVLAAHGVDQQLHGFAGDADGFVEAHEHDDSLGIDGWLVSAQALDAHLVELAVAALLRTLGAEHRACIHQLDRCGTLGNQVVLDDGADDAGRSLGTHGQLGLLFDMAAAKQRFKVLARDGGEHLLRDDVGCLSDAAHEERGLLDNRRDDGLVAVGAEDAARRFLEVVPERCLFGQHVLGSLGKLNCHMEYLVIDGSWS